MYELHSIFCKKKRETYVVVVNKTFFIYKMYALLYIYPSSKCLKRNPDLCDVDLNFSSNNMAAPLSQQVSTIFYDI